MEHYESMIVDMYRVYGTCKEMLRDRKYNVNETYDAVGQEEFYKMYKSGTIELIGTNETELIVVSFVIHRDPKMLSIPRSDIHKKHEHAKIIWILKVPMNNNIKIEEGEEVFYYKELIINRSKHYLVPKHELISETDKKELLSMYDCKDSQLPRILHTDFMTRYFGAKMNDIFRIYRPSPTAGTHVFYRIVK